MNGVHQVVAGAAPHDAITNHVLAAREVIRSMGIPSEVFCEEPHLSPALRGNVHSHRNWDVIAGHDSIAILHYSIDSPAFEHVLGRCRLAALHYHNITPAELLWKFNPSLARQCARGREALADFSGRTALAAADSHFNASELAALGFPDPTVIGILRPSRPEHEHVGPPSGRPPRVLFVGRGVPNKAQDDLILAAAALRQIGVQVEFRVVGSWGGNKPFEWHCRRLINALGLDAQVKLLGAVSDDELVREYAEASVFVCLSDHEGYCVPLIESIAAGLPVIAYRAGAAPETLAGAGVLLDDKRPSTVAEAIVAMLNGEMPVNRAVANAAAHFHSRASVAKRLTDWVKAMPT